MRVEDELKDDLRRAQEGTKLCQDEISFQNGKRVEVEARVAELEKRIEALQKFHLQVMAYCQPIISKSLWTRVEVFADQYNAAIEALKSRA